MKKFFYLMTAAAVLLAACSDDNQEVTLNVSPATINAGAAGTTSTIQITTGAEWNVSSGDNWVHVSPASGSGNATVNVSVAENTTTAARSAKIKVTAGDKTQEVTVNQEAPAGTTPPGKASISGPDSNCPEGTPTVTLTANAANATSYIWFNGTTAISGATNTTYAVSTSGTYYVVGKNANGEGTKSDPHQVTIYENCGGSIASIDELVGTWNSDGYVIVGSSAYENPHLMIVTKENETTIRIANMININSIFTLARTDEYLATVDIANMTITLTAGQECSPTIFDEATADQSILSIDADKTNYCYNAGVDFVMPIAVDGNGTITIAPNSGISYNIGGIGDVDAGFIFLAYKSGTCLGGGCSSLGLLWTKVSSATEAPATANTGTLTKLPAMPISQNK
jgi:hypothetical protein